MSSDLALSNAIEHLGRALMQTEGTFELPIRHYTTQGLYGRRCFMPAGSCVVSRVHKFPHITVALRGRCIVVDAQGNRRQVTAPQVWITQPGTQRALWIQEDAEWLTVHAAEVGDVEEAKDLLTCETMEQFEAFVAALPPPEDV